MAVERDKKEMVLFADILVAGDSSVGIPDYRERIPINIHIDDDIDLEQFREGLQTAYANILGDECCVLFDYEVRQEVPELVWGTNDEHEPNIGT